MPPQRLGQCRVLRSEDGRPLEELEKNVFKGETVRTLMERAQVESKGEGAHD